MPLRSDKVYRSLTKKGFTDAPGDHKFLELHHNGKLFIRTKISHGAAHDIGNELISKMAHQCKLDKSDFHDLVNCPLSAEDYLALLIRKGIIN